MDRKKLTFIALAAAAVLTFADLVLAFFVAAPVLADMSLPTAGVNIGGNLIANPVLFSQKIFYFHVPVAISQLRGVLLHRLLRRPLPDDARPRLRHEGAHRDRGHADVHAADHAHR